MTYYQVVIILGGGWRGFLHFDIYTEHNVELFLAAIADSMCSVHLMNEKNERYHTIAENQPGNIAWARFREWHRERLFRKWQLRDITPAHMEAM